MIALLMPVLFAAHIAHVAPIAVGAGARPAQAGDPACVDPAVPLVELARDYAFPPPASARARTAFAAVVQYLAKPTSRAYHNSLADYKWLETTSPRDLHVQMMLGILYASGPDINLPSAVGYRHNAIAGNSLADDAAARALTFVSQQDPSQWLAAVALTRTALVSPEKERMLQATSAVQRALRVDSSNIALQLAWHDLLVAQERAQESLEFARRIPTTCTAAQHALAESLLLTGDTAAGAKLYLSALAQAENRELHRFRDDMRVAATSGQLRAFAKTPEEQRPAWITKFWQYTATQYARTLEARISEHVIRSAYADAHFRATESALSSDKENWVSDTAHVVPWDSRGVTWVRHGAPLHRFRILDQCLEPYEAWVYTSEATPWVVWFKHECQSPLHGPRQFDWRPIFAPPLCGRMFLTRPVPDLITAKAKLSAHPEDIDRRDLYTLLAEYDPRYLRMLHECAKEALGPPTPGAMGLYAELAREGVRLFDYMQWSEGSAPQLAKRVQVILAAYEFQDAQHRAELATVTWIPLQDLGDNDSSAESIRFTYVIADSLLSASRVDVTTAVPSHGAESRAMLHNSALLTNLQPGMAKLRVIAIDPADTTRGGIRTVPINVRGRGAAFDMSDIVLAIPDMAGVLHRGAYSIEPVPGHTMDVGRPFRVFFEVYGVQSGVTVQTTVSVTRTDASGLQQLRRLFPGKAGARTVTFPRSAEPDSRGVLVEDVLLSGDLVPGQYTVDVTIKLPDGRTVTRHTGLTIIK